MARKTIGKKSKSKKIRFFMIGSDERPATDADISAFAEKLEKAIKDGSDVVTHHLVNYFEIEI